MKLREKRILAFIIDYLLIFFLITIVSIMFGDKTENSDYNVKFPLAIVPLSFPLLYYLISEPIFGFTLGKKIMKLHVVNSEGKRITFFQSVVRHMFDILDIFCLFGLVALSMSGFKKRIGDYIAKSEVVEN